jgi:hypothetical protein
MYAEAKFRIVFPYLGIGLQPIAPGIIANDFFSGMDRDGPFFQKSISILVRYI